MLTRALIAWALVAPISQAWKQFSQLYSHTVLTFISGLCILKGFKLNRSYLKQIYTRFVTSVSKIKIRASCLFTFRYWKGPASWVTLSKYMGRSRFRRLLSCRIFLGWKVGTESKLCGFAMLEIKLTHVGKHCTIEHHHSPFWSFLKLYILVYNLGPDLI